MRFGIRGLVSSLALVAAAAPLAAVTPTLSASIRAQTEATADDTLTARGHEVTIGIAQSLYGEWSQMANLAGLMQDIDNAAISRVRLDTLKAVNQHFAWLGLADPQGTVIIATEGVAEHQNVNRRIWFNAGLERPYVGDQQATPLSLTTTAPGSEPEPFIDLATPVRRRDGSVCGVLGAHLSREALRHVMQQSATGIDLLLLSRDGMVQIGPPGFEGKILTTRSAVAARQGGTLTGLEQWEDGVRYRVVVMPLIGYRDLPDFGWSVIVRQPESLTAVLSSPDHALIPILAITGGVVFLLLVGMGYFIAAPINRLIAATRAIAHPDDMGRTPVPEERAYGEAAALSAALVRLQSRVRMVLPAPKPFGVPAPPTIIQRSA